MKFYIKSDDEINKLKQSRDGSDRAAISVMEENSKYADDPLVGMFWYDPENGELFGVRSTPAEDVPWYDSNQWGCKVKTDRRLHKDVWKKERHRGKDSRFTGDHTRVPRGRVFQFEDAGFRVYVGDWIDEIPQAKDDILDEFQLDSKITEFVKDPHWEIGHGWTDEF